ncbi:hypothetical protein [Dactylosporangium matsuzakiense]|uniref:Uncharacterized protein n=1 Tax=Dactylosporangium matsuzakiense TaxID=53360 RepID=A0A9W6NNI0_9ACTN|nr:hypothetical protein [Dactylosporangium matsuzakiense]UWZ48674.1 hypothetical protein Dmats_21070 [Dactylosporangium matsuzakiense]GLL03042.1 hypothetical protein GCM10017581_047850 [Dactylosporangium matsuzakiense]
MNLEDQLTIGMQEHATGLALESDVLARAGRNHRRRVLTTRLGAAGLAGLLVAGLAVGVQLQGQQPRSQPAAPPVAMEQPSVRLANAAAASDDISYRFTLTDGPVVYAGAFDPKTRTGYLHSDNDAGTLVELLIAGTRYIGTEPRAGVQVTGNHEAYSRYGQYPGTYDRLSFGLTGDATYGPGSADPTELFKALRAAGAAITQNPDGTLHYRITTDDGQSKSVLDGDVSLNADGRIARIVVAGTWSSTAKGRLDQGRLTRTVELSDYGLPVTVQRPAQVVPVK